MASQIPEDFGSEWDMSDVVFQTLGSDGKELHANKSILATYSPYFHAMFFKNFKEAKEKIVNLECDYTAFKEILRFIHHVDQDFSSNSVRMGTTVLRNLYTTADMLDFPVIRDLCEAKMVDFPSAAMANVAHSFGLHDLMMNILRKLGNNAVQAFISEDSLPSLGPQLIFSKEDVNLIFDKVKGEGARVCLLQAPKRCHNLEDILKNITSPRIDLTQEWPMSDVSLLTKNSQGRVLYSNKAALVCISEHFKNLFFGDPTADEILDDIVIEVDAEYATVKQILSIVHHCNRRFRRNGFVMIHPVLLYDMYITASEDQLNIPMIKKFCCENLRGQQNSVAYDVAAKLGLKDVESYLMENLPKTCLDYWVKNICSDGRSYLRDGNEVVISSGDARELILCAEDVRALINRLREEE